MPTPNADDPLRITDHAPPLQPEAPPSPAGDVTLAPAAPASDGTRVQSGDEVAETARRSVGPAVDFPGYEVLGELGRGGMGVVYKARHLRLGRLVALKMVLHAEHAQQEELLRFLTEAEAVAQLQHPNIVQLFDSGQHNGMPYFTLELVEGGTLADKLRQNPLTPGEAARLVEQVALGVQHAHERGIIHRDLKPGNVLLAQDGTPRVADFGLAKRVDVGTALTATGNVMGTPSYMAPEQAGGQGKRVGPAADIYALGALLYECLSGRPPFRAATAMDTLLQVLSNEPLPLRSLAPNCPRDLETICHKCLQKEPHKRYASAQELAEDLRRFQNGEPIRARPVGRIERVVKWVKRNPVVTGMAVAVVLALAAGTTVSYLKYLEARKEADKAERASEYLVSIFELADASGQRTKTPRQILDDAEKGIPEKFADQPELRDKLLKQIGTVYDKMTATAPLAMILEASGTVQLQSTRDPNRRAVAQTLLYTGDRLTLADDAQVQLVILSDLHKERLHAGSEVTVRRKGCEPADAISERAADPLMTFVRLPKGTFYMGWGSTDNNGTIQKGVKTEIKEDFEIAVHDVTQGQWEAVMGENPSYFSRFGGGRLAVKDISDEELKLFPVESVSWNDAQEFIKKLNEKEGGGGYLYRLPTEAEWEYACRGGATSEEECSYHFYFDKPTNDLSSEQANFNGFIPFGKAPKGKYLGRTSRVGEYLSNKLGLCDMHGNVWQWCADEFAPGGSYRVLRGGSWGSGGVGCRAAYRPGREPASRDRDLGFRLARVPRPVAR